MFIYKVVAALLLVGFHQIECSILAHGVVAPAVAAPAVVAPVAPAIRYGLVAPQNIRPFAAQVSTFTKGLSVYAAPYAAGVLSAPAIVPNALPAIAPAPVAPLAPAVFPAAAPIYPGYASAPVYPAAVPAAPVAPAVVAPSPLLPAPFARSIHAVSPGVAPALGSAVPAAPYLG